jgi:hypothetical protein
MCTPKNASATPAIAANHNAMIGLRAHTNATQVNEPMMIE